MSRGVTSALGVTGTYSDTYWREVRILREVRTEGRYVLVASYFIDGP